LHEIEVRRPVGLNGVDLVFVFTSAFDLQDGTIGDLIADARLQGARASRARRSASRRTLGV
jgi:hypothetical protein